MAPSSAATRGPERGAWWQRRTLPRGWGLGLFVAGVVLPLFRERGIPVWDTMWVEDGPVYGRHVLESGVSSVGRGYYGYVQMIDRILALPVPAIPTRLWAVYFAVVSTLFWALAAAFVYRVTDQWIRTAGCRLALAALVVLSPAAAWETNASISNTMWAAIFVSSLAFLSDRNGRADVAMRSVAVFLGVTSSPIATMFAAIGFVKLVRHRRAGDAVVLAAFLLGLAVQAAATLTSGIDPGDPSSWRLVADLYGLRVIGSALTGELPLDGLWTDIGEPAVLVLVGVFAAIVVPRFRAADAPVRRVAGLLLGLSAATFLVPVLGRGVTAIGFDFGVYTLSFTRLTMVPLLLLLTGVAVLLDPAEGTSRPSNTWRKGFLIHTAVVVALGYSVSTIRGAGPSWSAARERAISEQCAGLRDEDTVLVPTTPETFAMRVSCGRLRAG